MSELRRNLRNTAGAITLVGASLIAASCSTGGEELAPSTTAIVAEQSPTSPNQSPPVLPKGEVEISKRMSELYYAGIQEVRDRYKEKGTLEVAFGLCAGWDAYGGRYTAVANPGFYLFETETERFSFIVFSSGETDETLGPQEGINLMNGPYEYAQKDASGNIIPGTHYAMPFDSKGKPATIDIGVVGEFSNGEWRLKAPSIGEGVSTTKVFDTYNPALFEQFCTENSALTLPILPEGAPS